MPDYRDYTGGDYLKAEDMRGRAPVRLTVASVAPEKIKSKDGEDTRLIARFMKTDKALVLNKTNMDCLALLSNSTDYDNWRGVVCELYHDPTVQMSGRTTGGLRLRGANAGTYHAPTPQAPPPPVQAPAAPDVFEDDIPF